MAGLYGIFLARPLLDLAGAIRQQMRHAHWRDLQGRHFSFHGRAVHVLEDENHQRWIRLADVRAIAGFTASDGALQLTYPNGWRICGRPASPHLSDEALLAHLAKERAPTATKLRRWVEREIVFPARRRRERHGVRLEALDFRASD
jgi:prophage antirepressor-like protein